MLSSEAWLSFWRENGCTTGLTTFDVVSNLYYKLYSVKIVNMNNINTSKNIKYKQNISKIYKFVNSKKIVRSVPFSNSRVELPDSAEAGHS